MNLQEAKEYLQVCCEAGIFEARDIALLDDMEILVLGKREADRARGIFREWMKEN